MSRGMCEACSDDGGPWVLLKEDGTPIHFISEEVYSLCEECYELWYQQLNSKEW